MSKNTFYKYATYGLILLNLILLGVFFSGINPPKDGGPKLVNGKMPHEILKLSDVQCSKFQSLARTHIEKVKTIDKEQKKELKKYFSLLTKDSPLNKDSMVTSVNNLEKQKIISTYQHLEDVKALLDDTQIIHFDSFVQHVLKNVLGNSKEGMPRHKKLETIN